MAGLRREGITHAAFEASSHGLAQYRTEGLPVQAGAFTNLSRDHLDYLGDMESYFDAKMSLFDAVIAPGGTAVIWADDARSADAAARARARGLSIPSLRPQVATLPLLSTPPTHLGHVFILAG